MVAESLRDIYENASVLSNGTSFTYRGFKIKKAKWSHPEHTELAVYNPDEEKVESLTVSAYDDFNNFKDTLDEIADYGPDDLDDWLER